MVMEVIGRAYEGILVVVVAADFMTQQQQQQHRAVSSTGARWKRSQNSTPNKATPSIVKTMAVELMTNILSGDHGGSNSDMMMVMMIVKVMVRVIMIVMVIVKTLALTSSAGRS